MVQWLGFCGSIARDPGLISGQGTKIPQPQQGQKKQTKAPIWFTIDILSSLSANSITSVISECLYC